MATSLRQLSYKPSGDCIPRANISCQHWVSGPINCFADFPTKSPGWKQVAVRVYSYQKFCLRQGFNVVQADLTLTLVVKNDLELLIITFFPNYDYSHQAWLTML